MTQKDDRDRFVKPFRVRALACNVCFRPIADVPRLKIMGEMVRIASCLVPLVAVFLLSACSLESFDVHPCELGNSIGFRISPIEGWFRDYHPRPDSVVIRTDDGRPYEEARVWETRLKYFGPGDKTFESRPTQKFIAYGQRFAGWDMEQPPKPLVNGRMYVIFVSDSGHDGSANFEMGESLPAC